MIWKHNWLGNIIDLETPFSTILETNNNLKLSPLFSNITLNWFYQLGKIITYLEKNTINFKTSEICWKEWSFEIKDYVSNWIAIFQLKWSFQNDSDVSKLIAIIPNKY